VLSFVEVRNRLIAHRNFRKGNDDSGHAGEMA
jgi:hypothetical protein